jgi:hypothetical protein
MNLKLPRLACLAGITSTGMVEIKIVRLVRARGGILRKDLKARVAECTEVDWTSGTSPTLDLLH